MRLKCFRTNMDDILDPYIFSTESDEMLRKRLYPINISFILEDIDRLQSMLLCELGDSYVQKSQRYTVEDNLITNYQQHEDIYKIAKDLYDKMTELKDPTKKKTGSLKIDDYVHGIPIEDARYILPICAKTTISVSMSGDKLVDLFYLINEYPLIFNDIKIHLMDYFYSRGSACIAIFDRLSEIPVYSRNNILDKTKFDYKLQINHMFNYPETTCGIGAMISRNTDKLKEYYEYNDDKASKVLSNVLSYGHTSVLELCRQTISFKCSIVTYHQYIRHRLFKTNRNSLNNIIQNEEYILPESIKNSEFYDEVINYIKGVHALRRLVHADPIKYGLILNCDMVNVQSSSNARIENQFLRERLCNNAQWEIRRHAEERLKALIQASNSKIIFKSSLPSCVTGQCSEGKLTCGRAKEMREKYKEYI